MVDIIEYLNNISKRTKIQIRNLIKLLINVMKTLIVYKIAQILTKLII